MTRIALALLLGGLVGGTAGAQTVDEVIALHQAGLSEATILTQIEVTGTIYALDKDELIKLKQAGLSAGLIQAMIRTGDRLASQVRQPTAQEASTADYRGDSVEDPVDGTASSLARSLDTYAGYGTLYGAPADYYPAYGYPVLGLGGPYYGYRSYDYGYPRYGFYHGVYGRHYYGHRHYHGHHHWRGDYRGGLGFYYRGSNFRFGFRVR